ncbi:MAG: response regulator, partial [Dolichospermum sp.]
RALRISLGDESALEIVGEAENGQLAIAQVENLKPDVVLMDIQMPFMDGVEATKQIGDRFPETIAVFILPTAK